MSPYRQPHPFAIYRPSRWRRFLCWLTWHGWVRASLDANSFDEWVETWSCKHCGAGPEDVFPRVVAKHRAEIAERSRRHNAELAAGWKYGRVTPEPMVDDVPLHAMDPDVRRLFIERMVDHMVPPPPLRPPPPKDNMSRAALPIRTPNGDNSKVKW